VAPNDIAGQEPIFGNANARLRTSQRTAAGSEVKGTMSSNSTPQAETLFERIIGVSSRNPFLVIILTLFGIAGGIYALIQIPLDAIPDESDVQVIVYIVLNVFLCRRRAVLRCLFPCWQRSVIGPDHHRFGKRMHNSWVMYSSILQVVISTDTCGGGKGMGLRNREYDL
jgi:hypothetical protein